MEKFVSFFFFWKCFGIDLVCFEAEVNVDDNHFLVFCVECKMLDIIDMAVQ